MDVTYLFSSEDVRSELYFTKGALAKGLAQDVVTYGVGDASCGGSVAAGVALGFATGLGSCVAVLVGVRVTC